ncbi:MAG: indole-3-glycerol phosphate synthase TrpC [Bacteroidota bacterium]
MNVLENILNAKRDEVSRQKRESPLPGLFARPLYNRESLSLVQAIRSSTPAIIAELKKASPSKGTIREDFDVASLARGYEQGGACAISVLTDKPFFAGSLHYLELARDTVGVPLLRKDFIIDPYQLHEAKAYGADAVLLIVAALEQNRLIDLMNASTTIGLETLVEVHSEQEAERALKANATLVGINNRDLGTFTVDFATTMRILPLLPKSVTTVSESGFSSAVDIRNVMDAGVHGFLLGESLMREADPGRALSSIITAVRGFTR